MLDSIIFCSTLALRDSLHSLLCRYTLFLSCTPTFVNWALPANKLRVMCRVFIKNMLEKHTPIKDSVFYAERGAEHRVWEELPSEAAAPLPSVAEFVRSALGRLASGLGLGCSSPPPFRGATSPRRSAGGTGAALVSNTAYSTAARRRLQTSSLFLRSISDLNAVNSPSSRNFFLWLMRKVAITYTSSVTLLILIQK